MHPATKQERYDLDYVVHFCSKTNFQFLVNLEQL